MDNLFIKIYASAVKIKALLARDLFFCCNRTVGGRVLEIDLLAGACGADDGLCFLEFVLFG